jgi:alkylation response protein AidB-like acyl-CoA dehydrogenase
MNERTKNDDSPERQAFEDLARDFSIKKLLEAREEHDRFPFGRLMEDAIKDAGIVGFYGINLASEFGGVDQNSSMVGAILEKISMVDASMGGILFANAAAMEIIRVAHLDRDCHTILREVSSLGELPLAFPSFSDPGEMDIPAVDEKGLASGEIRHLTLGPIAEYALIPARSGEKDFSYYLLNLKNHGVRIAPPVVSLGMRGCPASDIVMEKVPLTLIGARGKGIEYFTQMRASMSIASSAILLGIMKGALSDTIRYTKDRVQGGRQIIDWPQVRMMLAEMVMDIKTGESSLSKASNDMENDIKGWENSAIITAVRLGEMAIRTTTDSVQLYGGNGYTSDYPQEKRMRDARHAHSLMGMPPLRKMRIIGSYMDEIDKV